MLQPKNLNKLGLPKRKSGLSATKRAVGKNARASFAIKKRNKVISPDHQIVTWERVKVSESRILAIKRVRVGSWRGKSQLRSEGRWVPKRRGMARKKNLPKRSRRLKLAVLVKYLTKWISFSYHNFYIVVLHYIASGVQSGCSDFCSIHLSSIRWKVKFRKLNNDLKFSNQQAPTHVAAIGALRRLKLK